MPEPIPFVGLEIVSHVTFGAAVQGHPTPEATVKLLVPPSSLINKLDGVIVYWHPFACLTVCVATAEFNPVIMIIPSL